MPELVYLLIKLAFVALLWAFVLTVALSVRADLFGARPARVVREATPPRRKAEPPRPKQPRGSRRAPTHLVVTAGSLEGTTIPLTDQAILIGRASDSTLVLTDDYASARHAQITPRDGEWYVEDLGSTNGTFLGQAKVTDPTPVPVGTPVQIGKTSLELRP